MSFDNSRREGIKVFQIEDYTTSVVLLGLRLMFIFKNIVASTSLSLFNV